MGGHAMFLAVYETRKIPFNDGAVYVFRSPIGYWVSGEDNGENDDGEYHGFGDTPLAAIADYAEWKAEQE
jgi:hypothetical protein